MEDSLEEPLGGVSAGFLRVSCGCPAVFLILFRFGFCHDGFLRVFWGFPEFPAGVTSVLLDDCLQVSCKVPASPFLKIAIVPPF